MSGRFVAFEGSEGTGKTTQAQLLAERWGALFTFQPGGTEIGARIRSILLDPATERLDHRAEALLMAADRAQHVAEVVRPALAAGRDVVTDRYIASSLAYQGFGRGLPVADVKALSEFATDGLWPDRIVLLAVPADVGSQRLGAELDRFENEDEGFFARVQAGFAALAEDEPDRWLVVDGVGTVEEVAARIERLLG